MKRKLKQLAEFREGDDAAEGSTALSTADAVGSAPAPQPSSRDTVVLAQRRSRDAAKAAIVPYTNKQRTLVMASRGITARHRHLMDDVRALLPHHKKEVKHDCKKRLGEINELCDIKGANNCVFFEARGHQDLYMWVSKVPNGPCVKFHVNNIHTMDELKLTGNCLQGSRPLLSFAAEFDESPHMRVIKELLVQAFGTPRGHPKARPFVDHVFQFSYADGRVWFRNFQITDEALDAKEAKAALKEGKETISLVEIGPRFVLNPVRVFAHSFGGQSLYINPRYVTPAKVRQTDKKVKGKRYAKRKRAERARDAHVDGIEDVVPETEGWLDE